jgi:hypothetical protein
MDDKFVLKINSNNKEVLLCEKGEHIFKCEMEIFEETIKSNILDIYLNDKPISLMIDLINEDGKNKFLIKEK